MTVAIPVLNGMGYLPELVRTLRAQEWSGDLELLVYDSESEDGSWEWLCRQPDVTSLRIARSQFSHGATRQSMVETAQHAIVVFLTQDALPASSLWLAEIVRPFEISESIAAVVGRQTPRPDAPVVVKRDIVVSFANLGNPLAISIYQNGPAVNAVHGSQPMAFISDVNAAYRRDVLTGSVPFPAVDYAEDQAIARDLLDAGHAIAYNPFAEVLHSNDLTLANFRERIIDESQGLRDSLGVEPPTDRVWGRSLVRAAARDLAFALRDPSVPLRARVRAAAAAPLYEVRRRQAWHSVRVERPDAVGAPESAAEAPLS